ncbi:hypothetical protein GCM10017673_13150 [Streptosporangium violaceochromogenes]|nr:hypothetical protein GCM10017673_13150 [Streptosporangium violaceochromogenes]
MLHKMGIKSGTMYAAGVASIGLSAASWLTSASVEKAGIDRADRWGIFIGQWAPTFFAIGVALRLEETQDVRRVEREELLETAYTEGRTPSRAGI